MATTVTKVRIFVASPGDVASERRQIDNVPDAYLLVQGRVWNFTDWNCGLASQARDLPVAY